MCVYASDFHFHFVRVSVFSFIESNKWFDGTIFMFVHPELPLSEHNITQLRLIYPKIELVSIPETPHLAQYSKNIASFSHQVSEYCKILAFSLESPNLLYFSNTCLFRGEVSSILTEATVSLTPEKSIIYISCKNDTSLEFNFDVEVDTFLDSQANICGWKRIDQLVLSAAIVKNNKFFQYRDTLNKSRCIFYDRSIIISKSEHHTKIKQMWLHKNNSISTWLMSPRNIEISIAKSTSIKFKEPYIKKIDDSFIKVVEVDEEKNEQIETHESYKISIIIPAYKVEKYIAECISSIFSQTLTVPFEVLVGVDSCNSTLDELKKIRATYPNLSIYYSNSNVGPYVMRNTLVKFSKYPNLLFFDADDIMDPTMIKIIGNHYSEDKVIRFKYMNFEKNNISNSSPHKEVAHGVFFIPKTIFKKIGGFQSWPCGADSEFMKRCSHNRISTLSINRCLFYRRIHSQSLTQNTSTNHKSTTRNQIKNWIKNNKNWSIPIIPKITNLTKV